MAHTYAACKRPTSEQKKTTQTESKGLETNIPRKWTRKKKAGVAILISDKLDLKKKKAIKGGPEGHFIILKGRIHQEDITIVNI